MKILILPLYGIGDVLMTTPAVEILKRSLKCEIVYLCMFHSTYEILRENPFIDQLLYFPFLEQGKWKTFRFMMSIRGQFDYSINFYPSNRWQYNLIGWLAGAKKRIGHRYIKRDIRELNFLKNLTVKEDITLHNVEENVRLLNFLGINSKDIPKMRIYLTDEEIEAGIETVKNLSSKKIKVGIHTGTSRFKGHVNKRWAKEKFLELINNLPDYDFFLFGTKEEEQENNYIFEKAIKKNVFLIQNKSIRFVASIIKQMNAFISNDSGLMHLSSALSIPTVAIFGPTNPAWVRPWGVKYKVVRIDLPCSPCFYYSPEPLSCKAGKDFKCLKDIDVSMVKEALNEVMI